MGADCPWPVPFDLKQPIILPDHPFAHSVVCHLHCGVKHQGGHITYADICQSGYYLVGGTSMVRKLINQCFLCKKLRGKLATELMPDLLTDSLEDVPLFKSVGLDCFRPFIIKEKKTIHNTCDSVKVWVLIFVCLQTLLEVCRPYAGLHDIVYNTTKIVCC